MVSAANIIVARGIRIIQVIYLTPHRGLGTIIKAFRRAWYGMVNFQVSTWKPATSSASAQQLAVRLYRHKIRRKDSRGA
jgi:hypothetical protein